MTSIQIFGDSISEADEIIFRGCDVPYRGSVKIKKGTHLFPFVILGMLAVVVVFTLSREYDTNSDEDAE